MSFGEIIRDSFVVFFALYGIIDIIKKTISWFISTSAFKNQDHVFTVITVKNKESTIEGIVRSVVWQQLNCKNGGNLPKILIVDLGSTDDTFNIITRLADEYSFIRAINKEEYYEIIGDYEENEQV